MSLGDSYKRSSDLQIQYGVRLDANHFNASPLFNPDVLAVFGRRNDETPNRLYVSPRIGFSWTYGAATQIAAFEGAARAPRDHRGRRDAGRVPAEPPGDGGWQSCAAEWACSRTCRSRRRSGR